MILLHLLNLKHFFSQNKVIWKNVRNNLNLSKLIHQHNFTKQTIAEAVLRRAPYK